MLIYTGSVWQVDFSICMSNKQDIKCFLLVQAFHFVALQTELGMIWVHNRVKDAKFK